MVNNFSNISTYNEKSLFLLVNRNPNYENVPNDVPISNNSNDTRIDFSSYSVDHEFISLSMTH